MIIFLAVVYCVEVSSAVKRQPLFSPNAQNLPGGPFGSLVIPSGEITG